MTLSRRLPVGPDARLQGADRACADQRDDGRIFARRRPRSLHIRHYGAIVIAHNLVIKVIREVLLILSKVGVLVVRRPRRIRRRVVRVPLVAVLLQVVLGVDGRLGPVALEAQARGVHARRAGEVDARDLDEAAVAGVERTSAPRDSSGRCLLRRALRRDQAGDPMLQNGVSDYASVTYSW